MIIKSLECISLCWNLGYERLIKSMLWIGLGRILLVRPEDLQEQFDKETPASAKGTDTYARSLLEYGCFRALSVSAQVEDHLNDKEFRRLSYDMMLAWEAPGSTNKNVPKV